MNKNKLIYYALLIGSLIVTQISIISAQAQAMAGHAVNFFVHGLVFLLAISLVVWAILLRAKDQ